MKIGRALFWTYYGFFLLLSLFTILAPRHLVVRLHGAVWSWLLLVPPVWWLVGYIRTLYRGGE